MPFSEYEFKRLSFRLYTFFRKARAKCYTGFVRPALGGCGRKTTIVPPLRLEGRPDKIILGNEVYIEAGSWLQVLDGYNGDAAIIVGSGTSISGCCTISAASRIVIEGEVLMGRNVYISDHSHRYDLAGRSIISQGLDKIADVKIGFGAWIGQNCVILPGVTIGRFSVIGANSVVRSSVPDYCVAAGAPARIVNNFSVEA